MVFYNVIVSKSDQKSANTVVLEFKVTMIINFLSFNTIISK